LENLSAKVWKTFVEGATKCVGDAVDDGHGVNNTAAATSEDKVIDATPLELKLLLW